MNKQKQSRETGVTINPLFRIAGKQNIPQEDADTISLLVLICLDAVKRGAAPNAVANTLTEHMATAQALWSDLGNRPLYDQACKAWGLWCKACNREPSRPIVLTTTEYSAVRTTISYYLRSLTQTEVGRLVKAKTVANSFLKYVAGAGEAA